jgi:VanZ family protein
VFRALARPDRSAARTALTSFVLCVGYAALDEFRQTFVPSRVGASIDVALDTLGVALGLAARLGVQALSAGRRSPA